MIPWQELRRVNVPGEDTPLTLAQRGDEFVIRLGAVTLMSSRAHGSEEVLAERAGECIAGRARARVLIGGLGMGFTLAAALKVLPRSAEVVVAELVPAIVEWNRGPLAELAGRPLDDARVSVREGDVADLLRESDAAFDAILLDVDNGPDGLTRPKNRQLYEGVGLEAAFRALRDDGVLGVWSVAPDPAFTRRLNAQGFDTQAQVARARHMKGGRHTLWLARRPARSAGGAWRF
jgi:spermidine synthase